jgi:hypothetical protein
MAVMVADPRTQGEHPPGVGGSGCSEEEEDDVMGTRVTVHLDGDVMAVTMLIKGW